MSEKNPFLGATFAERKALREAADQEQGSTKAVDAETESVEDKSITPKTVSRKRAAKRA